MYMECTSLQSIRTMDNYRSPKLEKLWPFIAFDSNQGAGSGIWAAIAEPRRGMPDHGPTRHAGEDMGETYSPVWEGAKAEGWNLSCSSAYMHMLKHRLSRHTAARSSLD